MTRQAIAAFILAMGLVLGIAAGGSAADSRTGSRTCSTGFNVGASTSTTSSENHSHFYRSDSGQTRTQSTQSALSFGSSSFYRVVDYYNLSTRGFFSSASTRCNQNPVL